MKVYVIGPVTGVDELNRPAFEEARAALRALDGRFKVAIPHDFVPADASWREAMRISVRALLDHDAVAWLPGTEESRGASVERDLAEGLGMPCSPLGEWLGVGA